MQVVTTWMDGQHLFRSRTRAELSSVEDIQQQLRYISWDYFQEPSQDLRSKLKLRIIYLRHLCVINTS